MFDRSQASRSRQSDRYTSSKTLTDSSIKYFVRIAISETSSGDCEIFSNIISFSANLPRDMSHARVKQTIFTSYAKYSKVKTISVSRVWIKVSANTIFLLLPNRFAAIVSGRKRNALFPYMQEPGYIISSMWTYPVSIQEEIMQPHSIEEINYPVWDCSTFNRNYVGKLSSAR